MHQGIPGDVFNTKAACLRDCIPVDSQPHLARLQIDPLDKSNESRCLVCSQLLTEFCKGRTGTNC